MNLESFPWVVYIVLAILTLVSLGLALPLSIKPMRRIIAFAVMLLMIGFGLYLATVDGMPVSALASWSSGKLTGSQILTRIGLAVLTGAFVGMILMITLRLLSRGALPQLRARFNEEAGFPQWKRLAIAFYSGILEEIIYRLFLLSILAWVIGLVWHIDTGQPTIGALWLSNILAAIVFGLVHLPRWSSLTRLSPAMILALLSMNGLGGLVFGYLFITYGIEAAIIGHFTGDCVLHLIGPGILST